jgi:preprotein translocase subunit Sec63
MTGVPAAPEGSHVPRRLSQHLAHTSAHRLLLVVVGWISVFFLVQRIANAASNSSHAVYDPFSILGITASATEKEIKKHYKKLSIKL